MIFLFLHHTKILGMKNILYAVSVLVFIVIGFFVWFFKFYLGIPELNVHEDMSETEKIEAIDSWFSELQKDNQFNGVVFMSKNGNVLLSKAYGFSNYKKEEKLTNQSALRLASVSKQFTAAAILILVEKAKLDLDENITSYMPDLPYKDVTVRHLLNQTSGIPDIYMDLAERNKAGIDILTNQIAVELLTSNPEKPEFNPGDQYQYSNTNYIILGRLVELLSDQSLENFMLNEMFKPLGMKNTRVWNLVSEESTFPNKADDFDNALGNATEIKPSFIDGVAGDGAVFSSAEDMLIWDRFWYENNLISPSVLKEAFKTPKLKNGKHSDYGFGWVITENGMWHNGAWLGANTVIMRNTVKKSCMAIFDNSSNMFFDKILKELGKLGKT